MSLSQKNLKRFQGQSFLEILRVAAYFDTSFDMIHTKMRKSHYLMICIVARSGTKNLATAYSD